RPPLNPLIWRSHMSVSNIISQAERTGSLGDKESLREVLDFLVTEEQLGVTLVCAAIENAAAHHPPRRPPRIPLARGRGRSLRAPAAHPHPRPRGPSWTNANGW